MKIKRQKKGFTIVELVIVIAVIAVLSAILIPTFAGLVRKANVAADTALVKDLNTVLATDKALNGKHATMHEALEATKESGLDVSRLNAKVAKNEIMWDSANDVFCYLDDGKINYVPNTELEVKAKNVKAYQYYVIRDVKAQSDISTEYSTYVRSATLTEIETTKGLDVGNVEGITLVTYTSSSEQTVVIRTNSANTNLTINAASDTVNHYGNVGKVDVQKVDVDCYNEHGTAAYVKVTEGKVVAKAGGKISVVFANNTDATKAYVIKDNGGNIEEGYTLATVSGSSNIALMQKTETEVEEIAKDAISDALEEERKDQFSEDNYWIGVAANSFAGGDGSEVSPYLISNASELARLSWGMSEARQRDKFKNAYYKLTADIDLSSKCWVPISYSSRKQSQDMFFSGVFDGNNHKIIGLNSIGLSMSMISTMTNGSTPLNGEEYVYGLFGSVFNATIKNLNLVDVNIKTGTGEESEKGVRYLGDSVGALIGYAKGDVKVNGITVSGLVQGYDCVGGIIGRGNDLTANNEIKNCTNNATVNGVRQTSGIVGTANKYVNFAENIVNNGIVTCYFINDFEYVKTYYVVAGICILKSVDNKDYTSNVSNGDDAQIINRRLNEYPSHVDSAKYKVIETVSYGN